MQNADMSDTWISHYSEIGSSSTGQAINIRHIHKIRTFVRSQGSTTVFSIAFDRGTDSKDTSTQWSYPTLEEALSALAHIVCAMEGIEDVVDNYLTLVEHKTFRDLAKGFGTKKAA